MGATTRNILLLAAASFLADVSGEMLMAVLPFLLVAQGAGAVAVGIVGGASDALGHLVKAVGGVLGDRLKRRKPLIIAGYMTAALARFGIAQAVAWPVTLAYRGVDRIGKGLRSAPRDALLAESTAPGARGRAFGLHRAADTAGALVGSAIALALVSATGVSTRTIVFAAALIGLTTLAPLLFVREIRADEPAARRAVFEQASPHYRGYLVVAGLFALGNVSYLFYMLRAADVAGGETGALLLYLGFNAVYVIGAYPAGALSDKWDRPRILAAGFLLASLAAASMAFTGSLLGSAFAFGLLGLSFAAVDGTERAYAADLAGTAGRSTRLGLFHMTVGLATVAGGLIAGGLWSVNGPVWTFAWGALVPLVAIAFLLTRRR